MSNKYPNKQTCIDQTKITLGSIKKLCKQDIDVGLSAKIIEHKVD